MKSANSLPFFISSQTFEVTPQQLSEKITDFCITDLNIHLEGFQQLTLPI